MKTKSMLISLMMFMASSIVSAHCDTMDGPVVIDARTAIAQHNVNYALKWVRPEYETETREAFNLIMKVRELGPDAKELSEKYFFETLVRLHRSGEGEPYTGLKPAGSMHNEVVLAADRSVESGDLSFLQGMVPAGKRTELAEHFAAVMELKNYDTDDVSAGREYVESYVRFFKFALGEEEVHPLH